MDALKRIGGALAGGVENVIAFTTSKRVLSMVGSALAIQAGLPPELGVLGGGGLVAGFTVTDAMGKGKGASPNGK